MNLLPAPLKIRNLRPCQLSVQKLFFFFFLLIPGCFRGGTSRKVWGKITNNKLEPLPNASLHLKTSSVRTPSKEDGSYELFISKFSYGLRDKDVNGAFAVTRKYNPFNQGYYTFSARREFRFLFQGDAYINMIKRSNIYLNNELGVGHGSEIFNGLFLRDELGSALRRSVSSYKTGKLVDSLPGDVLNNNQSIPFDSYNALYGKVRLDYTPFQKYRREPSEKIIFGSAWPAVFIEWRKGIKDVLTSDVDFDYLEWGASNT